MSEIRKPFELEWGDVLFAKKKKKKERKPY
jgi:hypothetical protein